MCGIEAAIIASTIASVAGTGYAAKKQSDAFEENAEQANIAKMKDDQQTMIRRQQEEEDAAQAKVKTDLEARKAAARARVAEGESGGFLNNNAVIQDIFRQGLTANQMTTQNLQRSNLNTQFQLQANENRAQSRINSVAQPDPIATALEIGGQISDGATSYYGTKQ